MRVSDVERWAACEQYGIVGQTRQPTVSAAAWVGTMAHGYLTGQHHGDPDRVAYDDITPAGWVLYKQAARICDKALAILDAEGWEVAAREVEVGTPDRLAGRLDLLCTRGGTSAVIDLKTGRAASTGWLQVGGYLKLLDWDDMRMMQGGILHVPRTRMGKEQTGSIQMRPADRLWWAWTHQQGRIERVLAGDTALRQPGPHCNRCPEPDCPVRV